jgi:hypothetical protein
MRRLKVSKSVSAETLLGRLFRPGQVPVSPAERQAVTHRLDRAVFAGSISGEQADERRARLSTAKTRNDLTVALGGLSGSAPAVLPRLLSLVTLVWFGAVLIQLAVWLMIGFIGGHFSGLWWLWSVVVGGALVGALWLVAEGQ